MNNKLVAVIFFLYPKIYYIISFAVFSVQHPFFVIVFYTPNAKNPLLNMSNPDDGKDLGKESCSCGYCLGLL
jgi:hypothetical protein